MKKQKLFILTVFLITTGVIKAQLPGGSGYTSIGDFPISCRCTSAFTCIIKWDAIPGATGYYFQYVKFGEYLSPYGPNSTSTETTKTLTDLMPNTKYTVKVNAAGNNSNSQTSFTTPECYPHFIIPLPTYSVKNTAYLTRIKDVPNAISYTWTVSDNLTINNETSPVSFTTTSPQVTITPRKVTGAKGAVKVVANFRDNYTSSMNWESTEIVNK